MAGGSTDLNSLCTDKWFKQQVASMSRASESAQKAGNALLKDPEIKALAPADTAEFKTALTIEHVACAAFTVMVVAATLNNKVVNPKRFTDAFEDWGNRLGAQREANAYFDGLKEAKAAATAAAIVAFCTAVLKSALASLPKLQADLKNAADALKAAEKGVKQAEFHRAMNLSLSLVMLAIPEVEGVSAILVSCLGIAGHIDIDYFLGQNTKIGTLITVLGDSDSVLKKIPQIEKMLGDALKPILGIGSAMATLKFDADEADEAKKRLAEVTEKLEKAVGRYEAFAAWILPRARGIPALVVMTKACVAGDRQGTRRQQAGGRQLQRAPPLHQKSRGLTRVSSRRGHARCDHWFIAIVSLRRLSGRTPRAGLSQTPRFRAARGCRRTTPYGHHRTPFRRGSGRAAIRRGWNEARSQGRDAMRVRSGHERHLGWPEQPRSTLPHAHLTGTV